MIRKAEKKDIKSIMEILPYVVAEMNDDGNYQWTETYPLKNDFEEDIKKGEMYVYDSGAVEGFMCITKKQPAEYETVLWSSDAPCYVIRRMAVSTNSRHKGIAKELMLFAERLAAENGVFYIKTNTCEDNIKMQMLFEKMGYNKLLSFAFKGRDGVYYGYEKLFGN